MALIRKHGAGGKADFREFVVTKLLTDETLSAREQENISKELSSFQSLKEGDEDIGDISGGVNNKTATSTWLNNAKKEFDESTSEKVQLMPKEGWGPEKRTPEGFSKYLQRTLYGGNEHTLVRAIGSMTDNNKIKQYVIKNAKDYTRDYVNRAYQESIDRPDNEWHNKQEMEQAQNVLATIDETKAINDDDWNAVVDSLRKLGESPEEFLRSAEQLENMEKVRLAKEQENKLNRDRDALKNLGASEELLEELKGFSISSDYEPFKDLPFLQKALVEGGYTLVQSPDKSVSALLKNGELVKNAGGLVTDDQLSPHFGKTWGTAENGAFLIFDKENIDENKFFDWETVGPDEFETRNVARQILTTDPRFKDYEIKGYSGDDQRGTKDLDIFGRRQFTKEFSFTKDGKTFKVIRGDDGVYRKEGETKRFTMPESMSFGEGIENIARDYSETYFKNPGSPLYMLDKQKIPGKSMRMGIPGISTTKQRLEDAKTTIRQFEKEYDKAIKNKKDVSISPSDNKRLAEFLTHVLTSDEYSKEQKEQAEKIVHRQAALALKKIYNKKLKKEVPLFETPLFMWRKGGVLEPVVKFDPEKFRKWKEGGVLKAEKGSSLTDFYKASSELSKSRPATESSEETGDGAVSSGYHDPTGTVGDSNAFDWVSGAGTVASFIPGVGAIGGLISTGADAANALIVRGEWTNKDTVNLLSNIGFTILAGAGLGAAKGLKVAGTAAKTGGKAGRFAKMVRSTKAIGTSEKVANLAAKAGTRAANLGAGKVVKASNKLTNLTKAAKGNSTIVSEILKGNEAALRLVKGSGYSKTAEVIADLGLIKPLGLAKKTLPGRAGQSVIEGIKNLKNIDFGKIGKGLGYTAAGVQMASGAVGAANIVGNVVDEGHLWKGVKKSQMSDVNRMLQAGALGYGMRQNILGKRALDRQTELTYSKKPERILNVQTEDGVKAFNLSDAPKTKIFKSNTIGKKASNKARKIVGKDPSSKKMNTYKKELSELLGEKQFKEVSKALDAGASTSYTFVPGTATKRTLVPPKDINNPREFRENMRARDLMSRGSGNYFTRMGKKQEVLTGTRTPVKPASVRPAPKKVKSKTNSTLGTGKYKRSTKPMPRTIHKNFKNAPWYKKMTPKEQATIRRKFKSQENAKKWLQASKEAKKNLKTTKKQKGGIIKHKVGGPVGYEFPWSIPTAPWQKVTPYGTIPTSTVSAVNAGSTKATGPTSAVSAVKATRPTYFWDNPGLMSKTSRKWGDPSVFNTQMTTPTLEDYFSRNKRTPLTTPGGYSVQAEKPKYSYDSSKEYTGAVKTTEDPGLLVDQYGHISWDRNKFKHKNLGPLFEAGRLAVSEAHNKKSSALRTRGIIESIPRLSGISSTHLRTSAPLTMEAHRQAGDIQSGARRVGRTVNINDSISAMLTGQKNASDLITKAASEDANRNKGTQDQQMAIDRETMAHNTAVGNQQSEIGGRARQALYNEAAGLKQKTGENYSAFLAGLKREHADKPRRTLFDRYFTEMQDPNIEGAREWYGQMTSDEKIASRRNDYNKRQEALKKANVNHVVIPYEQSQEYLDYIKHVNKEVAPISTKMSRLNQIASILSMYSPSTTK